MSLELKLGGTDSKICPWKTVANNDVYKKGIGDSYITLEREDIKCYACDGYDLNCSDLLLL